MLGRHAEQLVLTELLDDLRAGRSRALVLRGEPGMGKSALLEYAVESADDALVLGMVAVESETAWSFAAVHQLLLPLLSRIQRLPTPQQRALRAAFGAEAGPPANQSLVGHAVLTLLADAIPFAIVVHRALRVRDRRGE